MSDYVAIIPMVSVMLAAIAAMLAEAFRQPGERMPLFGLGLIGLVGAAVSSVMLWDTDARSFGVVRSDNFALFINLILCVVGILTMLFSTEVVEREGLPPGEFYALTLFGLSGMMLMAAATDLLVIFLALEVLSLSVYVLTGLRRASATGAEAAFKYFLLGAFSSAFFLYGIAFAFAVSGSTRLEQIGTAFSAQGAPPTLALLAVGLLAVGFAFKVSAVPFHMASRRWTSSSSTCIPSSRLPRIPTRPSITSSRRSTSAVRVCFAPLPRTSGTCSSSPIPRTIRGSWRSSGATAGPRWNSGSS